MTFVQKQDDIVEPTINASVFRRIRADIMMCRLAPDEWLRVDALRRRYGVGGSPIREALMRLQAESLVVLEQNKGFRVAPVSREELIDLMRTRVEIESIALRWAIGNGGVEWEAELLAAFHLLSHHDKTSRQPAAEINTDWFREHRRFHAALVGACGSPKLMAIRESLFDQAERFVALSIVSRGQPRDDAGEHEQIMRAALAREVERAVRLNADHIERTAAKVAEALEEMLAVRDEQPVEA